MYDIPVLFVSIKPSFPIVCIFASQGLSSASVSLRHLLVMIHRLLFRKGGFVTIGWRRCTCWWFFVCKPVINICTCIYQNEYRHNSKQQINQPHTLSFFSVPLWSVVCYATLKAMVTFKLVASRVVARRFVSQWGQTKDERVSIRCLFSAKYAALRSKSKHG